MSGRALTFFGITGGLAFLALSFPPIVFVAALFLIVPGLILWVAAPVFLYSVLGYLTWHLTDGMQRGLRLAIVLGTLATFAVVPAWLLNLPISDERAALIAHDVIAPLPPLRDKTLAIFTPSRSHYGGRPPADTDCDAICQRLLYNGAVKRIIRGAYAARLPTTEPAVVRAYRIERRDTCPAATLPDETDQWPGDPHDYADRARDRVAARIAAGECLISEAANIGEADYVLRDYSTREPPPKSDKTLIADTIRAKRIEFGIRTADGSPRIIHRKTQVESLPVAMPFMIANDIHSNTMEAGFLRLKAVDNPYTLWSETRALFGEGVKFPDRNVDPAAEVAVLLRALDDPARAATDPQIAVGDQVLKRIGAKGRSSPQDAEAVRRLIEDRRFTSFFSLADAVWRLGPEAAPLAGPLLKRLIEAPLPAGRDTVQTTSRAIANLPPGALLPVISELERLAAIEGRRGTAYLAMSRLGDAGASGVRRLVALMETRHSQQSLPHHADERSVVIGAVLGLCRMGPNAAAAIEDVLALLREDLARGSISSRGDLAVMTLGRMGAADRVLALAEGQKTVLSRVQFKLREAERPLHREQCSY